MTQSMGRRGRSCLHPRGRGVAIGLCRSGHVKEDETGHAGAGCKMNIKDTKEKGDRCHVKKHKTKFT